MAAAMPRARARAPGYQQGGRGGGGCSVCVCVCAGGGRRGGLGRCVGGGRLVNVRATATRAPRMQGGQAGWVGCGQVGEGGSSSTPTQRCSPGGGGGVPGWAGASSRSSAAATASRRRRHVHPAVSRTPLRPPRPPLNTPISSTPPPTPLSTPTRACASLHHRLASAWRPRPSGSSRCWTGCWWKRWRRPASRWGGCCCPSRRCKR